MAVGPGPIEPLCSGGGACFATPLPGALSQKPLGLDGSVLAIDDDCTAFTTAVSALDIYSLCQPARDATVLCSELEKVLQERFGDFPSRSDGRWFPGLLGMNTSRKRVDFLSFWLGLGRHLSEDSPVSSRPNVQRPEPETEPLCLLSTIRGMECFGRGVLGLCRNQSRNVMLPSQELVLLLQEVRSCAQDPSYWDEVIEAVPDDPNLRLSLPEIAEAAHVWLRDCVRAEVDGSDIESNRTSRVSLSLNASPAIAHRLIASNRSSIVNVHASPARAQAFTAWACARSNPTSEDSSQGIASVESQFLRGEVESASDRVESGVASQVTLNSEAVPDTGVLADVETEPEPCPELQQAENAAEILFSHVDSANSAHVEEAMRCLSAAHQTIGQSLNDKAAQIKELHANLDRMSQLHATDLEKVRKHHEAETAAILNQMAASRMALEGCGGKCVLCLDGLTSHASVPCGHLAFCGVCAAERPTPTCPVCRQPSQCIVRIFKP